MAEKEQVNTEPRQPITENYSAIRAGFNIRSSGFVPVSPVISDSHGFYLQQPGGFLSERFASLDKLFYQLIMGIVEDPDFAVQKDSKIYEKMLRDPQIFYCLGVRSAAISSLPWLLKTPPGMEQDKTALDVAKKAEARLRKIPRWSELLDNVMAALLPGLSVNELTWRLSREGAYVVKDHYPVNKDRVKFDKQGRLYLLSPQQPTTGQLCPPYKFITHLYNVTDGSWKFPETGGYSYYGRGLADTPLFHYFHFKMMALKFLLKELERYGIPSKILYTGPQNQQLADKLVDIMVALKNDSVVAIPGKKGEVQVDTVNVHRSGNMFILFINYVDSLITKTILGQELMTEMPGIGSYAAAAIHRSVFAIINEQDRMLMRDTLNRTLVRYDMQLNAPSIPEELFPVFDFKKSPLEDTTAFLDTVRETVSLGIDVSEAQVREYTGLREPLPGEKIVRMPEPIGFEGNGEGGGPNNNNNKNDKKNMKRGPNGQGRKNDRAGVSKLRQGVSPGRQRSAYRLKMPRVSPFTSIR